MPYTIPKYALGVLELSNPVYSPPYTSILVAAPSTWHSKSRAFKGTLARANNTSAEEESISGKEELRERGETKAGKRASRGSRLQRTTASKRRRMRGKGQLHYVQPIQPHISIIMAKGPPTLLSPPRSAHARTGLRGTLNESRAIPGTMTTGPAPPTPPRPATPPPSLFLRIRALLSCGSCRIGTGGGGSGSGRDSGRLQQKQQKQQKKAKARQRPERPRVQVVSTPRPCHWTEYSPSDEVEAGTARWG